MSGANKNVTPKKRGRPATGKAPHLTLRMSQDTITALDLYAEAEGVSRSEAIRKMIQFVLEVQASKGQRSDD